MSWWDTALSVASTIGKVAGALSGSGSGSGETNAAVGYRISMDPSDDPKLDNMLFQRTASGSVNAMNTSTAPGNACQLFFPGDARDGLSGTSIIIPPFSQFDVSLAFETYSRADVDDFLLTPASPASSVTGEAVAGDPPPATIQSQGTNIPANMSVAIGPYFTANVSSSDRTVQIALVGTLVLTGIVLLNVRGAGKTFCRIANILRNPKAAEDDGNSITVTLPGGIDVSDGLQSIDIMASVTGLSYQALIQELRDTGQVHPITDQQLAAIGEVTLL